MKSFTNLRNLYGSISNNTDSANMTLGDEWINDGHRMILGSMSWWFMEKEGTPISTVASQQYVELPADFEKMESVKVTIGSTNHIPKECQSREQWDRLNSTTSITSDTPEWYFIFGKRLYFYPTPASSTSNAVTPVYKKSTKDLSIANYTIGTIVSITSGATALVGSGTTWTAAMVGRYIRITDSDTALKGDGQWYEIGSYTSATSIGLSKPYQGTTIAAGAAAYTIGQMPPYPETYHVLPVWYALSEYYDQKEDARSTKYYNKFINGIKQMKADVSQKSVNVVLDRGIDYPQTNPNLFVKL
jgi:hypothetical protein